MSGRQRNLRLLFRAGRRTLFGGRSFRPCRRRQEGYEQRPRFRPGLAVRATINVGTDLVYFGGSIGAEDLRVATERASKSESRSFSRRGATSGKVSRSDCGGGTRVRRRHQLHRQTWQARRGRKAEFRRMQGALRSFPVRVRASEHRLRYGSALFAAPSAKKSARVRRSTRAAHMQRETIRNLVAEFESAFVLRRFDAVEEFIVADVERMQEFVPRKAPETGGITGCKGEDKTRGKQKKPGPQGPELFRSPFQITFWQEYRYRCRK